MPTAFHARDWEARAAVTSGPGTNTLRSEATSLPMLLTQVKVLESCMTSVMDEQQVSIYIYGVLEMQKTPVNRHVKYC